MPEEPRHALAAPALSNIAKMTRRDERAPRSDSGNVDVGLLLQKVRATASGDAFEKRRPEFLKK
jgi:hypothetical protein